MNIVFIYHFVVNEDKSSFTLKLGNEPDRIIVKDTIKERSNALPSMPDMKALMTKREIRDLVSFPVTLGKEEQSSFPSSLSKTTHLIILY